MNLLKLSWSYIKRQKLTTFLNVLLLALGIGTIVLLALVREQFGNKLERDAQGIDMVVGAKGSPLQLILSGIYHMDVPTGNIPLSEFNRLKQNRMIANAIPLALGDSYKQYRIVGTTASYPEHYDAKLASGEMFTAVKETVIGATVATQTGLTIGSEFVGNHGLVAGGKGHDDHPFKVVGILSPTGTVLDNLILTSIESVWDVHGLLEKNDHEAESDGEHSEETTEESPEIPPPPPVMTGLLPLNQPDAPSESVEDNGKEITLALIQFATPLAAATLPRAINAQTNMMAARPAEQMANLLQLVGVGLDSLRAFGWILVIVATLSMFIALYNAMQSRRYDLAILRSLGASRSKLLWHVILEGILYALMGMIAGLLLGHVVAEIAGIVLASSQQVTLTGFTWVSDETFIFVLALIVGVIAALVPAIQAYKTDISETLAQ